MKQNPLNKEQQPNRDKREQPHEVVLRGETRELPSTWAREGEFLLGQEEVKSGEQEQPRSVQQEAISRKKYKSPEINEFEKKLESDSGSGNDERAFAITRALLRNVRDMHAHFPQAIKEAEKLLSDAQAPHALSEMYAAAMREATRQYEARYGASQRNG